MILFCFIPSLRSGQLSRSPEWLLLRDLTVIYIKIADFAIVLRLSKNCSGFTKIMISPTYSYLRWFLILHCASLVRTIFALLARAHERVLVLNVRDFPESKLDSEINAFFLLNKHCDLYFHYIKILYMLSSLIKGAQSRYFELFWASKKLLLNWRKPENNALQR